MQTDWTPERRARLEALIETHDEMARRFAGYHKTAVSRGDYTVWDGRSEEEAQITMSVRAALAEIDRLEAHATALAEALEPFAKVGDYYDEPGDPADTEPWDDDDVVCLMDINGSLADRIDAAGDLEVADFRRARSVLTEKHHA